MDGTDGIVIATVRPATILGDVAVAVHPDDERYRDAIGREVVVPYVERPVPVIADARVDPAFGSGALKITPGHDPIDFEIGREHGLPEPIVIGLDGRMNDHAGDLAGPRAGRGGQLPSSPGSRIAASSSSARTTAMPSEPASGVTRGSSR